MSVLFPQAHAKRVEGELDVQKLVDRETGVLNERIEDLQGRVEALKKELKKKRSEENNSKADVDALKKVR